MAAHFSFNFLFSDTFHVVTFLLLGIMYAFLVRQNLRAHNESRALKASNRTVEADNEEMTAINEALRRDNKALEAINKTSKPWLNDLITAVEKKQSREASLASRRLPQEAPCQAGLPHVSLVDIVILAHKPPNSKRSDMIGAIFRQLIFEEDLTIRAVELLPTYCRDQRSKKLQLASYAAKRCGMTSLRDQQESLAEILNKGVGPLAAIFSFNLWTDEINIVREFIRKACEVLYQDENSVADSEDEEAPVKDSEDEVVPVRYSEDTKGSGEQRGVKRRKTFGGWR